MSAAPTGPSEAPQTYRPLSLLAVLAVVLGAFYSVLVLTGGLLPFARVYPRSFVVCLVLGPVLGGLAAVLARSKSGERVGTFAALGLAAVLVLMGLGGLVLFSGSSPWEPGPWTWVVLALGLLVSFLALSRIKSSEGALAGHLLARAGLYLCLFFGGFYLLYVTGNQFAVTNQAEAAADRFVERIRKDDLPRAFFETIRPGSRPGGGDVRDEIERGYNVPRGREPGEYSGFCTSAFVQSIRLGGEGQARRTGTAAEFKTTGYEVSVRYDVENGMGKFGLLVLLQSVEVGGRREWQVIFPACRIEKAEEAQLAKDVARAAGETMAVTDAFLRAVATRQDEAAFLMTQPTAKRHGLGRALLLSKAELSALAGPVAAVAGDSMGGQREELAAGTKEFVKGGMVGEKDFAADPRWKEAFVRQVRDWIGHKENARVEAEAIASNYPDVRRDGDELEVSRPVRFTLEPTPPFTARMFVEGELVIRGNLGREALQDRYRVVAVRLVRSSIAPLAPKTPTPGSP